MVSRVMITVKETVFVKPNIIKYLFRLFHKFIRLTFNAEFHFIALLILYVIFSKSRLRMQLFAITNK